MIAGQQVTGPTDFFAKLYGAFVAEERKSYQEKLRGQVRYFLSLYRWRAFSDVEIIMPIGRCKTESVPRSAGRTAAKHTQ